MIEQFENKIINADCLDILKQLPDKCVDLVLTDPPYGIAYNNKKMNRKSQRDFKDIENDNMELDYVHLIKEFLKKHDLRFLTKEEVAHFMNGENIYGEKVKKPEAPKVSEKEKAEMKTLLEETIKEYEAEGKEAKFLKELLAKY